MNDLEFELAYIEQTWPDLDAAVDGHADECVCPACEDWRKRDRLRMELHDLRNATA